MISVLVRTSLSCYLTQARWLADSEASDRRKSASVRNAMPAGDFSYRDRIVSVRLLRRTDRGTVVFLAASARVKGYSPSPRVILRVLRPETISPELQSLRASSIAS